MIAAIRKPTISPFNNLALVEVYETNPGQGIAQIPDAVQLQNHLGIVHGGSLFTLGDVAAAHAVYGLLQEMKLETRAITRSAEIVFLKMARGAITATARVVESKENVRSILERGASLDLDVYVEFTDTDANIVAKMNVIWYIKLKVAEVAK